MAKSRQAALILSLLLLALAAWTLPGAAKDNLTWGDYSWGVYGGSKEASRLGREQLMSRENYCPTSGCVIRLDSVTVQPQRARKGGTLVLATSYTILTPEQIAIPVTITREVMFKGKSLGKTKTMETRKLNGSWDQETNFTLPADAIPGDYTLITQISTGFGMDGKTIQFRVDG
jgi:hypothetical protein